MVKKIVDENENENEDEDEVDEVEEEIIEDDMVDDGDEEKIADKGDASEQDGDTDGKSEDDSDEDEVVLTIAGEEPKVEEEELKPWVNELRKNYRDSQRENRMLKEQLKAVQPNQQNTIDPGKKPTLEQFEFDTEEYEKELSIWYDRKRLAEDAELKIQADREREQEEWNKKLVSYNNLKSKLKFKDFGDAEELVKDSLSVIQQGLIIECAENSALVVYALGKNQQRLKELSAITSLAKFASKIGALEKDLSVKKRAKPPSPEKIVKGSGSTSGALNSTLEKLRAEAEKTNDYTKVYQYKREQKAKIK